MLNRVPGTPGHIVSRGARHALTAAKELLQRNNYYVRVMKEKMEEEPAREQKSTDIISEMC